MPAISETPTNTNFLSPLNFKFQISRAPSVNFFIQKVNIPGFSLPDINVNNPLLRIPYPGEHLLYDELSITYKVDENLQNYMEIFNWLKAIGKQDYAEYKQISEQPSYSGDGVYSDITLSVLTSERNPHYDIVFHDAFPVMIASLEFDSTLQDVIYLETSVKFRYTYYDIQKVS